MDQITFSETEYQTKKRKTRREIFLKRMDRLIPWKQLKKKVACSAGKKQTNNGRIVSEISNFCRFKPRSRKISGYSDLP